MEPAAWERAKRIIVEAQALPPAEREAFVRRTCHDTPELCGEILPLLEDPEFSTHSQATTALENADLSDLGPGARVGPYIIVDRIGQGGMGQVFLATDPELRRRVALKCLLASDSRAGLDRARILNEAIAAAAINHANVATVHHVVEHGDRVFIVMEFVDGENLAVRLRRDRLPLDRILAIGRQLAAALKAAHDKGVIHRDIKPANIQIRMDGSVKVLDFGVARAARTVPAAPDAATTIARPQPALTIIAHGGTPTYMSPEQLRGGTVDERSDLYSLGVVLFEMATGRRPFPQGDTAALVDAQARGAPRADATQTGVPTGLAEVIARALDMNPAARYQSAAEIDTALEELERDLGARAASIGARALRWLARIALGILALGAIGLISTVGFNQTFGRTGAFGAEPWPSYFIWGLRAVFPSAFIMTATAVIVLAARFGLRTLELVGPIGRLTSGMRTIGRRLERALGLNKPAELAQALTGLAVVTLVVLWRMDQKLIVAWGSFFSSAPIEALWPMRESTTGRLWYHVKFEVAILAFGFGLFKVIQLRKHTKARDGLGMIAALTGVIALMVLMDVWPYRTFSHRDFERIDFAGARCYLLGEAGGELLILCPASDPPRNRTVRRDDPDLRRLGVSENVFKGVPAPGSSQ